MTARARLPTRRQCERFSFEHAGIHYAATVGIDSIGSPLEVFLQGGKAGSSIDAMARDIGVFISLALQYGVPLAALINAITRLDDGKAAGPGGRMLDMIAEAET